MTEIARSVNGPKLQGPRAEDAMAKPYFDRQLRISKQSPNAVVVQDEQFDFGQFDFGQLAEIELAEVEIGRSQNWPEVELSELEKKNWPKSELAQVDRARAGFSHSMDPSVSVQNKNFTRNPQKRAPGTREEIKSHLH